MIVRKKSLESQNAGYQHYMLAVVVVAVIVAGAEAAEGAEAEEVGASVATGTTSVREAVTGVGPKITLYRTVLTLQLAARTARSDAAVPHLLSVPSRRRRSHQPLVSAVLRVIPLPWQVDQRPAPPW